MGRLHLELSAGLAKAATVAGIGRVIGQCWWRRRLGLMVGLEENTPKANEDRYLAANALSRTEVWCGEGKKSPRKEETPVSVESSEAAPAAAAEESSEASDATAVESSEAPTDAGEGVSGAAPAGNEESSESTEEEKPSDEEVTEETPEIKLETAPADFRFPTTNQSRHCFTRYIEYHRCVAAKGEGAPECDKFAKYYRSLCPGEWIDRWNEQRENGTFPGPL
ncbi:hypothetical protein RJ639_007609 [Escallonia herrerae]|uniref:Uncharacterized protein n=1 Tax=Escallonia herrerae TaxID=1293975 RepID=A0AA89ATI8_9ASTE|nr:hypothetical protein RJ639_007609 [Escallonia herrerae]